MKFYSNDEIMKKQELRNKLKKAIKIITYPFIVLLVLLVLYSLLQRVIEKNTEIRMWGYKAFVVKTGSMEKTIGIGDLIVERIPHSEDEIKNGTIVSVNHNGNIITHRIVKIENDANGKKTYTTRGDNNNSDDPEKSEYENIIGVYKFKIPRIGAILLKFHSIGVISAILVILLITNVLLSRKEDREIIRHEKRQKNEEKKNSSE